MRYQGGGIDRGNDRQPKQTCQRVDRGLEKTDLLG